MSNETKQELMATPDAIISLIERAATNPEVDIEKMERLLEMQERIVGRHAETEFNAAMTLTQAEMGRVSADAINPQTRSKYASYHQLDRYLRPIYTSHGFSLSFDTADPLQPDYIRMLCYVSHSGGHSRTYTRDLPADGKGAKGGDVMTKTHASGAAQSYGMRYLLKGIFNVAVGEDDTDGNAPPLKTITNKQAADIEALISEVGADKTKFLKYYKVESVTDIPGKSYKTCVKSLERKRGSA